MYEEEILECERTRTVFPDSAADTNPDLVQELIGQKLVEVLEKILWEDEAAECPPLRLADTEWTRQVLQLVMATISKQRQNEALIWSSFSI